MFAACLAIAIGIAAVAEGELCRLHTVKLKGDGYVNITTPPQKDGKHFDEVKCSARCIAPFKSYSYDSSDGSCYLYQQTIDKLTFTLNDDYISGSNNGDCYGKICYMYNTKLDYDKRRSWSNPSSLSKCAEPCRKPIFKCKSFSYNIATGRCHRYPQPINELTFSTVKEDYVFRANYILQSSHTSGAINEGCDDIKALCQTIRVDGPRSTYDGQYELIMNRLNGSPMYKSGDDKLMFLTPELHWWSIHVPSKNATAAFQVSEEPWDIKSWTEVTLTCEVPYAYYGSCRTLRLKDLKTNKTFTFKVYPFRARGVEDKLVYKEDNGNRYIYNNVDNDAWVLWEKAGMTEKRYKDESYAWRQGDGGRNAPLGGWKAGVHATVIYTLECAD